MTMSHRMGGRTPPCGQPLFTEPNLMELPRRAMTALLRNIVSIHSPDMGFDLNRVLAIKIASNGSLLKARSMTRKAPKVN